MTLVCRIHGARDLRLEAEAVHGHASGDEVREHVVNAIGLQVDRLDAVVVVNERGVGVVGAGATEGFGIDAMRRGKRLFVAGIGRSGLMARQDCSPNSRRIGPLRG